MEVPTNNPEVFGVFEQVLQELLYLFDAPDISTPVLRLIGNRVRDEEGAGLVVYDLLLSLA